MRSLGNRVGRRARRTVGWALGVGVAAGGLAWWAHRSWVNVTVSGLSMYPTYRDGARVLVRRRPAHLLNRRDVVVIEQPPDLGSSWDDLPAFDGRLAGRRWNIKRLVALPGDQVPDSVRVAAGVDVVSPGSLVVLGDNIRSRDSRKVGFYPADRVLGVVVRQLHAGAGTEADSDPPAFRQELSPPWVEHRLERNGHEICTTDRDDDR